jgi:predicted aspartyl protease
MNGSVLGGQARVWVLLRRVGQPDIRIEFTIDTGSTVFVTLPRTSADALDLPSLRVIAANLADDTSIDVSTYLATLLWDGQERDVEALATGARLRLRRTGHAHAR